MSFSIQFFARNPHHARAKLERATAPAGVKALIELALANISLHASAGAGATNSTMGAGTGSAGYANQERPSDKTIKADAPTPLRPPPILCGIFVETHGHIDEGGGRSSITAFRVEPYYD